MSNTLVSSLFASITAIVLPSAAFATEVVIDKEHSSIKVDVKASGHSFSGTLQDYDAVLQVDSKLSPTSGLLTWNFSDLKTGDKKRDGKMLEWLEAPKFGQGSFRFRRWNRQADGKTLAVGTLEIHGVKKEISFPVDVQPDGTGLIARGSAVVDYTDFDLPVIVFLKILKVDPSLTVRFEIHGDRP